MPNNGVSQAGRISYCHCQRVRRDMKWPQCKSWGNSGYSRACFPQKAWVNVLGYVCCPGPGREVTRGALKQTWTQGGTTILQHALKVGGGGAILVPGAGQPCPGIDAAVECTFKKNRLQKGKLQVNIPKCNMQDFSSTTQ